MFQIRLHGRGGQGVVTAAEMLSVAGFVEGRHAQAFPSFGSERTGAPVVAFCRFDDRTIRLREPILAPDAVVVADPTLIGQVDVLAGLTPDGYVLVNSEQPVDQLGLEGDYDPARVLTVPGTDIAKRHIGRPLPNAVLLAALAAQTGWVRHESVLTAIRHAFSGRIADANVAAADEARDQVVSRPGHRPAGVAAEPPAAVPAEPSRR